MITDTNRGISIQIRDKGNVRNVSFSDIIIETRRFADDWWGSAEPIAITALDRDAGTKGGKIEDIRFFNITCVGENGVLLYGMPDRISNIRFENLSVKLKRTSKWTQERYDLRPGEGDELLMLRPVKPFFAHCVDGMQMRNITTVAFSAVVPNALDDMVFEDCTNIKREG